MGEGRHGGAGRDGVSRVRRNESNGANGFVFGARGPKKCILGQAPRRARRRGALSVTSWRGMQWGCEESARTKRIAEWVRRNENGDKSCKPRVFRRHWTSFEVQINQSFPDQIHFLNEDGRIISQQVKYEWAPVLCSHCNKIGHVLEKCRKKSPPQDVPRKQKKIWKPKDTKNEDKTDAPSSPKPKVVDAEALPLNEKLKDKFPEPTEEEGFIEVLEATDQIVHCKGRFVGDDREFFLSFVYAQNDSNKRKELWDIMQRLSTNDAWCVLGDFNTVLNLDERIGDPSFPSLVSEIWDQKQEGYLMHQVTQKLKRLKGPLRTLNRDKFQFLDKQVEILRTKLHLTQAELKNNLNDDNLLEAEKQLTQELYLKMKASFLLRRQQAKADWITFGDHDSKLFYAWVKKRKATNQLTSIRNAEHEIVEGKQAVAKEQEDIEHLLCRCEYARDIYRKLLPSLGYNFEGRSLKEVMRDCLKIKPLRKRREIISTYAATAYAIWKARNQKIFQEKSMPTEDVFQEIIYQVSVYMEGKGKA
ncbi:hypothetical protein DM860_008947 [Cuscuta australis]|uniref:CCHC-type domain-containing protein n=1 Tax=Cuscuta australis TaxID=267555 RepID=A0A328D7U4_9ASTE|nr:hypothetical protein DM860_008947 [Cuscuta australis]